MDILIDGHNLIAGLPGMSLSMPDDEARLLELLAGFARVGRHRVEVYFDGAPPGEAGLRSHGRVRAHFVSGRSTADAAIRRRLRALGGAASTWSVVSSDRTVQAAAREAHAAVLSAKEFAGVLHASLAQAEATPDESEAPLSEAEVREWEAIFRQRGGKKPGAEL